jgi:hypothetical protein
MISMNAESILKFGDLVFLFRIKDYKTTSLERNSKENLK